MNICNCFCYISNLRNCNNSYYKLRGNKIIQMVKSGYLLHNSTFGTLL